jgi:hypothetical protein
MVDKILTLVQMEDFFQDLTTQMLGLNPTAPENQNKVRIAWPAAGAPAFKITQDVTFLMVNNIPDNISAQRDVLYEGIDSDNTNQVANFTRVHEVRWIVYGPNSYDLAERIKNSLYLVEYREQCNVKGLYLILDVITPNRVPENFNGQWWDRSDFSAKFNEDVRVGNGAIPYINSFQTIMKGDNE